MSDPLRLSPDELRAIYTRGFETWSALHVAAEEQAGLPLPLSHLNLEDAFRHHPSFPLNLHLDHEKVAKFSRIHATGCSAWTPNQPGGGCKLPPFQQHEKIAVALWEPLLLQSCATSIHDPAAGLPSWFKHPHKNYIAVLVLAWSYILSARWTEIMSGETSLVYTSSMADAIGREDTPKATFENPIPTLDIQGSCPAEARWWAAILAEGQGWKATLSLNGDTLFAPWSIIHQPRNPFLARKDLTSQNGSAVAYESAAPPSFLEALHFLDIFCSARNIADQSQAALAAVLLMPSYRTAKGLQLPAFRAGSQSSAPSAPRQHPDREGGQRHSWAGHADHLDRLMTLSCRDRGVTSMLLSAFYDPLVECNAAAPWIQGSFAAIRLLTRDSPAILGRMLMDRQPNVAPLWVGATILGLQDKILRDAWRGMIPLDLLSAASSETIQSFVQEPVSDPLVVNGNISRADQCRLLFFSQKEFHKRLPMCLWKPIGENPVGDTDLEVQAHAQCRGHRLWYQAFTWNCLNETTVHQPFTGRDPVPARQHNPHPNQAPVDYAGLEPDKEHWSENSTRSIFGWLRFDGFAPGEGDIWRHEWFDVGESEEEEESEESNGNKKPPVQRVEDWLF